MKYGPVKLDDAQGAILAHSFKPAKGKPSELKPGDRGTLAITINVPEGSYTYSTTTPKGQKTRFMISKTTGLEPTGKRVEIRYMDFWKVVDGKIVDNWVMVDFPHVLAQLGVDVFGGEGWEAFDRGEKTPPQSDHGAAA